MVEREFCFEWESGICQWKYKSEVRTCEGDSGTFYVYYLKIAPLIPCNFGYCALKA